MLNICLESFICLSGISPLPVSIRLITYAVATYRQEWAMYVGSQLLRAEWLFNYNDQRYMATVREDSESDFRSRDPFEPLTLYVSYNALFSYSFLLWCIVLYLCF